MCGRSWADPTQPYPLFCSKAQPYHNGQHRTQPLPCDPAATPHPAATLHAESSPAATTLCSLRTTTANGDGDGNGATVCDGQQRGPVFVFLFCCCCFCSVFFFFLFDTPFFLFSPFFMIFFCLTPLLFFVLLFFSIQPFFMIFFCFTPLFLFLCFYPFVILNS